MKQSLLVIALLLIAGVASASRWWPLPFDLQDNEQDSLTCSVSLSGVASSGDIAPFWLISNHHGRVSAAPYSGALTVGLSKPATRPHRWFDYDFALSASAYAHSTSQGSPLQTTLHHFPGYNSRHADLLLHEANAHARLYIIDVSAGVMPLRCNPFLDESLSSGDLLFSAHSPSFPAVSAGIFRYTPIPGLFGYLQIRGGITHAWMTDALYTHGAFIHYKYIGLQAGGSLPVRLTYEFHHAAQWGGVSPVHGDLGNSWQAFRNIFLAREGGNMFNDQYNAQGNHLGSQLLALTFQGKQWHVHAYWQNFLEDNYNLLGLGQNLPDGLFGITAEQTVFPYLSALTIEYLCTADQSGPLHDQDGLIYAGCDQYYQNSVYQEGWNNRLFTIGTPFITSPFYNRNGCLHTLNSRVKVWHAGLRGDICGFRYRLLGSYVRGYGNYHDGGDIYALRTTCTSWLLEVSRHVPKAWGLDFSLSLSGDHGSQWGNNLGAMLTITKKGLITTYGNHH